jgi:hypothetical protein
MSTTYYFRHDGTSTKDWWMSLVAVERIETNSDRYRSLLDVHM